MKVICMIVICLLSLSIQCFGQDYKILLNKPFRWSNSLSTISDSSKIKIITSLDHWLTEYFNQFDWLKIEDELDNFVFIDLDMNGELEIVYEGFSGGEPIGTTIFKKNSEQKYIEIFTRFGIVESLWMTKVNGDMYFDLVQEPCCAGVNYSKETWKYDGTKFELIEKINWIEGTQFPDSLSKPQKFTILNDPYTLRSSPFISKGNILTTFSTGDMGYALAEKSDKTGRVWWFVFVENNSNSKDKTFYDYAYDDQYYSVGWMSSRFLKPTYK